MKNQNKKELQSDTSNKKSFIWIGFVVIAIAFVTAIYLFSTNRSGQSKGAKEKVSLGISKSFLSIPVYIAKEKGFFSDEGIEIIIKEYGSGKLATKSMFNGEVDISTVADIPVVFNSFKRQDFCVFATFTTSYHFVSLLTRNDTGIKTGADLKGKRIGANKGTSSHFYLAVFLADNQLSASDVEIIHYKTIELPNALKNNEVDAISVWQSNG
jgi:NitT/TauT family transport system substrate-binding protein